MRWWWCLLGSFQRPLNIGLQRKQDISKSISYGTRLRPFKTVVGLRRSLQWESTVYLGGAYTIFVPASIEALWFQTSTGMNVQTPLRVIPICLSFSDIASNIGPEVTKSPTVHLTS